MRGRPFFVALALLSTMRGRPFFVALALLPVTACAAQRKPVVAPRQGVEPSGSATVAIAEPESPPPKPERFACRPTAVGDRAHVVFEMSFVFGGVDAKGNDIPGTSQPARATYVITLLDVDERGPLRAQVELEDHQMGTVLGTSEFSWTTAVQRSWVEPHLPVILKRGDTGWELDRTSLHPEVACPCPPDDPLCPCDAPRPSPAPIGPGDAKQNATKKKPLDRPAFFASLGRSVELIALDTELAPRLEGKRLGDIATLGPSSNLAQRLGLKPPVPLLEREGKVLPALFATEEKTQRTVQRTKKDASGNEVPAGDQNQYLTVTREVALGADCRFRRLAIETDVWMPLMEGQLPSGARITRGYSWTVAYERG